MTNDNRIKIFTDLSILQAGNISLKRYFNSIKRSLPKGWTLLFKEIYQDNDTFFILEDYSCIQTPLYRDANRETNFFAKMFLGLTDYNIVLLKIEIIEPIDKNETVEMRGFLMHRMHEEILKTNKHYKEFIHNFEFRGPLDQNWQKEDLRDARLLRLRSLAEDTVYSLSKKNESFIENKKIEYPDANNISISLSIMKKSFKRAIEIQRKLLKLGKAEKIAIDKESKGILYDYFEEISTSIIFAYISVESMANAAIPESFQYNTKNERGIAEVWSKQNIERWMSTSEKITAILPLILSTTDIKQEKFWCHFKELEKLRNEIVHQKTRQEGFELNTDIYSELLNSSVFAKIKSALYLISFFYNFDNSHPYFPLGLGMAEYKVHEIESMEAHFKLIE